MVTQAQSNYLLERMALFGFGTNMASIQDGTLNVPQGVFAIVIRKNEEDGSYSAYEVNNKNKEIFISGSVAFSVLTKRVIRFLVDKKLAAME